MNVIDVRPLDQVRYTPEAGDELVRVTATLRRGELEKFNAFMSGDAWEKAQAARNADLDKCAQSVAALLNAARQHLGTSGGRVCATLLASLYNGDRVKFDVSDLRRLDQCLFEHAMNTMRICYELNREPHQFFDNGGRLFEEMIETWGLEKKRRGAA